MTSLRSDKFELSPFLVIKQSEESILCYSTITNKLVKLTSAEAKEIFNDLSSGKVDLASDDSIVSELLKCEIITQDLKKQKKRIDNKVNSILFSNEVLEVTILPTDACNFNCAYCYQKPPYKVMHSDVEEKIISFFSKNVSGFKTVRVNWFGGEPLLQKEQVVRMTEAINQICKQNKVPFISRITTNGYHLDLDSFSNLVQNRLLFYQITLDGPKHIHDTHRPLKNGGQTFEVILNNLENISKKSLNRFFQIYLRVNVTPRMVVEMDEVLELYNNKFGKDKRFVLGFERVQDWGGEKVKKLEKEEQIFKNNKEDDDFYALYKKAESYSLNLNYKLIKDLEPLICSANKKNGYVFNHNGDVLKCPMAIYAQDAFVREANKISELNNKGSLSLNSNKDYWEGSNLQSKCDQCAIYPVCFGLGCPLGISFRELSPCKDYNHRMEMIEGYINSISDLEKETIIL